MPEAPPPLSFEELRRQYVTGLAERLVALRAFYATAETGATTQQDREDIRIIIHSMLGTGTTFGFPEITGLCQVLQEHLHAERIDCVALAAATQDLIDCCEKIRAAAN